MSHNEKELNGDEPLVLKRGSFQGEKIYLQSLQDCIIYACQQSTNTLIFCDADFAQWPLSSEPVLSALTQWAASSSNQRSLTVLATTYQMIEERHSAWKRWRQRWSHRIECLQTNPDLDVTLPTIMWSSAACLTLHNERSAIGSVSDQPANLIPERERLLELIRRSEPAFPASTLGLW